jgi:hypothetical protein
VQLRMVSWLQNLENAWNEITQNNGSACAQHRSRQQSPRVFPASVLADDCSEPLVDTVSPRLECVKRQ